MDAHTPPALTLARPLVALDIESTGPNPETDRIIELALVTMQPDGQRTVRRWYTHPGCPIPPASTAVHGITDEQIAGAQPFEAYAADIAAALTGCDLTGYNLRAFDLVILRREFERADVAWPCDGARVVDTFVIFRDREKRDLAAAVKLYCNRYYQGAHVATNDAEAALDVLFGQLAYYPDLPRDLGALDVVSGGRQPDWATELGHIRWNAEGDAVLHFGRHVGTRLIDADDGLLRWILNKDFPADVREMVSAVLYGDERPRAPGAPPLPARPRRSSWEGSDDPDDHEAEDDDSDDTDGASDNEDIPF